MNAIVIAIHGVCVLFQTLGTEGTMGPRFV